MESIYEFKDYKNYLIKALSERGLKTQLSQAVNCNPAYLTNVLNGNAHLSLEQGEDANIFFGHDDLESEFFLLLISKQKAGTSSLTKRLDKRLQELRKSSNDLKYQLNIGQQSLSDAEVSKYYSHWAFGGVHATASIPKYDSITKISQRLSMPAHEVSQIIKFLISSEILKEADKRKGWEPAKRRVHLSADSTFISFHHLNWRLRALEAIRKDNDEDLHYSSVVSISEIDFQKIRKILINAIKRSKLIISKSEDEDVFSLCLDLFRV